MLIYFLDSKADQQVKYLVIFKSKHLTLSLPILELSHMQSTLIQGKCNLARGLQKSYCPLFPLVKLILYF